jgi:hypothetical protein
VKCGLKLGTNIRSAHRWFKKSKSNHLIRYKKNQNVISCLEHFKGKTPLCRGDRQKAEERELYSDCTHYYEKVWELRHLTILVKCNSIYIWCCNNIERANNSYFFYLNTFALLWIASTRKNNIRTKSRRD